MRSTSQSNATAYHACLDEARRQAPLMAKRWYTSLSGLLFEKSTTPAVVQDKHQIHDAWLVLKKHQADIEQGFAQQIAQAIERNTGGSNVSSTRRSNAAPTLAVSSLKFQDLELMGEDQVQDTLDEARLAQTLLLTSEAGLAGFSARLSTAQGLKMVTSDKNPLRPEVYASALVNVLQGLPVEIGVRTRWLIYGGQIMGELLQALYVALDELLEKMGIKLAAYAVMASPDEPKRSAAAQGDANGLRLASPPDTVRPGASLDDHPGEFLSREQLLTLDHLHRLMSGNYNDSFISAAGNETNTQAEFGAVPHHVQRRNPEQQPRSLGQSLAIEVVGLMIEKLTADQRLLPPVRQVIATAEPAFSRLAAADPAFFSNKNHPARRLLEAVTAKSLAFADEADGGFADFMQDLNAVTVLLTKEHPSDARHFEVLLNDFEGRQARRNQAFANEQNLAVQALLQAEQRNLLAEKIAAEIKSRPDFVTDHHPIASFITGPWAQVMAKERLMGEHGGLGQRKAVFSLALGDMLWSLDFAETTKYRKRLVKILPGMLESIRDGLLSIDFPLAHSKAFFDELMRLHEIALTAVVPVTSVETSKSKRRSDLDQAFAERDAASSNQPWLAPSEAQQSGFMDNGYEPTRPNFQATLPQRQSPDQSDREDLALVPDHEPMDLSLGDWVELPVGIKWVRAQLTWISPHNTLFMFTSEGGRSHSMTAPMLQQMMSQSRFKIISQQGVMDGAFDSVARAAVRNSVEVRSGF